MTRFYSINPISKRTNTVSAHKITYRKYVVFIFLTVATFEFKLSVFRFRSTVCLGDVKKDTYCKYIPEIPQSFKITIFSGV